MSGSTLAFDRWLARGERLALRAGDGDRERLAFLAWLREAIRHSDAVTRIATSAAELFDFELKGDEPDEEAAE